VRRETVRADVGEAIARSFAERDVAKPLAVALDRDMDDIVAIGKEFERAENAFGASVDGAESDKNAAKPMDFQFVMKMPSHCARFWSSLPAGDEIMVCSVGRIRYNDNSDFRLFSLPDNRMKPRAYPFILGPTPVLRK
jgi:hypothetical protein